MKPTIKRIFALLLVVALFITMMSVSFVASASEEDDVRNEISRLEQESQRLEAQLAELKKQKADQVAMRKVYEAQIANLQKEINAYTSSILQCKKEIEDCLVKIEEAEAKIVDTKETFKKRIRSMHMSNTDNNVQLLLGAQSFSDFLTIAQLTKSMTNQDQIVINKIIETVNYIEQQVKENEARAKELAKSMTDLESKKATLAIKEAEVNKIISGITSTQNQVSNQNASIEQQLKDKESYLNYLLGGSDMYSGPFDGTFLWPVPGFSRISAYWQSNDSVHKGNHKGIDIAGPYGNNSAISGAKVVASASGTVAIVYSSCSHNYGKSSSCGYYNSSGKWVSCGNGFGNNVRIDHGGFNGQTYRTVYAHLKSVASGIYVGKYVSRGETIGYVGTTGWSTGYHLHFAIAVSGAYKNPLNYKIVYN